MALVFYENSNGSASALLCTFISDGTIKWTDITSAKDPSLNFNVTRNGMSASTTLHESYPEAAFGIPFVSQSATVVDYDLALNVSAVFTPISPIRKSNSGNVTLLKTLYTSSNDFNHQQFATSEHSCSLDSTS